MSDVGDQAGGNIVTVLEVGGGVVREPNFAIGIFGDEDLQGQIESDAGRSEHERRAAFGIPEDEQLCVGHVQASFFRFAAMVDDSKELDVLGPKN